MAIIFVGHAAFGLNYVRAIRMPRPALKDKDCPRVAVILCLRGRDPSLEACLAGLIDQDYPHYEVAIVVDQRGDPAWQVAARAIDLNPQVNVSLQPLLERRSTCSLKCSAIVQAVSQLEENSEVEVYALIDQDVIPHTSWIRELVTPLADAKVGASCGYRWFTPQRRSLASCIRAQWNAGSVGLMIMNQICWGGSLAVKASFIRNAQLLDKWSRAICEDTMVGTTVRAQDLRVALLPSLPMVNQESCKFASLFPFIRRQTLFGFLYNPNFKVRNRIVTVVYNATLAGALVTTCVAAARGNSWAYLLGSLLAGYVALLLGVHWRIEAITADLQRRRGRRVREPDANWLLLMLLCFPLSQLISLVAVLSTLRAPAISWRGIRYRIRGPFQIEKLAADETVEQPALADERLDMTHS